jgi:hypothetical protein
MLNNTLPVVSTTLPPFVHDAPVTVPGNTGLPRKSKRCVRVFNSKSRDTAFFTRAFVQNFTTRARSLRIDFPVAADVGANVINTAATLVAAINNLKRNFISHLQLLLKVRSHLYKVARESRIGTDASHKGMNTQ